MSGMGVLHRGTLVARFFELSHASGMANPQLIDDGDEIPPGFMVQPHVEAETAFVLEKDLAGPSVTSANALAAIAGGLRALEIIDSRVADHGRDLRHSKAGTLVLYFPPFQDVEQPDRRCADLGRK
jgi:hypothetical protein